MGSPCVIAPDGAVEDAVSNCSRVPDAPGSDASASTASSTTIGEPPASGTTEDTTPFITDPTKIENARLWRLYAASTSFPVMAPGYLPEGYQYIDRRPWDEESLSDQAR